MIQLWNFFLLFLKLSAALMSQKNSANFKWWMTYFHIWLAIPVCLLDLFSNLVEDELCVCVIGATVYTDTAQQPCR